MKKRLLPILAVVGLLATILMPFQGYAETSLEEINKQLNKIKQQEALAKKKATQVKHEKIAVLHDKEQAKKTLNDLLDQIDQKGEEINQLNDQIDTVTLNLQEAATKLDDAKGRVASREQMLKSRLRLMYQNGFVSYLDVMLHSTSFSDFITRFDSLRLIVGEDENVLEANRVDQDNIEKQKIEIANQLDEVKNLYAQAEEAKQELVGKEQDKEVTIASLTTKEKQLEQITEEQQKELIKIAKARSDLEYKKKHYNYYTGGKFLWPVPGHYRITSPFGAREDPINGKAAYHKGMDIGAPKNSKIIAAEKGVVIVAGWVRGYGNTVILDHGGGLWTLYGHINYGGILVKKGQVVERGHQIARVGSTGRSTGYHLHFGVYLHSHPIDPLKYLK